MTKLQLTNLHKAYGEFTAVEGLNLSIDQGETVALLGPSGCGKSTTLNMIVGLTEPTSGDIFIDGKSVINSAPGARGIGLVFQDYAVFGNMTVRGNLAFGLKVRKLGKKEIQKEVEKTAELLNLTSSLDASTADMGGSELQRVALGRTLVTNPSILLLDEPLSNLEAAMRNEMRQELRRIQKQTGQTVIYVTHDQIEALSLAHQIAVMQNGRLVQYGPTYDVYHYPAEPFVGGFLGNPPMNFINGELLAKGKNSIFRLGDQKIEVPKTYTSTNCDVTLGIRPESIQLSNKSSDIAGTVTLVEQLGADAVVSVDVEGQEIKVLADGGISPDPGSICHLKVSAPMINLFDPSSGVRMDVASPAISERTTT